MSTIFSGYEKMRTVNSLNITWLGVNCAGGYHQLALRSESYLAWLISKDPLLQTKQLHRTFTMLPSGLAKILIISILAEIKTSYNLSQDRIYVKTREILSLTFKSHKLEN